LFEELEADCSLSDDTSGIDEMFIDFYFSASFFSLFELDFYSFFSSSWATAA
jgi:hypothetical protein